jgi:peptide chain release factor 1
MLDKLGEIEKRFELVEQQLQDPNITSQISELQRLGKLRSELEPVVETIRAYKKALGELQDARTMLDDPDMREMAQDEIPELESQITNLEARIKVHLIPKDPNDDKPVIFEIRPAAGGDEAALFTFELFRMYSRYAERRKWKYEVVDLEDTGIGGASYVCFTVNAPGAYSQLKFESGVHRVQRVPKTESGGRIHTSTVTVAVLPEVEVNDVKIDEKDLEISTYRASSAGGQNVQKVETAIRIIHKPTGTIVTCQDERSQTQNKLRALQVLASKLQEAERLRAEQSQAADRRSQIGSGDRSEKIRTYNFPQSRITDHRIKVDVHNTVAFMDGDIQEMIDALIQEDQARKMGEGLE